MSNARTTKKLLTCSQGDDATNILAGKTIIVTGSNTGIGKETARDFVKKGARVILACRNLEKANAAADDIKTAGSGQVVTHRLDLSSFKSIHQFAKDIIQTEERIDILVNNAGLMVPKGKTEDNFDLTFGTNHLGPFLLTYLLLDKIKASAPARIVNVSSRAHEKAAIYWDDINFDQPGSYEMWKAYCQSKLCNILFTKELAARLEGTGVKVYCLHPGVINSDFYREVPRILRPIAAVALPLFTKTVEQGAQTTIYCAVSEKVSNQSGLYYSDCAEKKPSNLARDEAAAKRLWDLSMQMCGIKKSSTT